VPRSDGRTRLEVTPSIACPPPGLALEPGVTSVSNRVGPRLLRDKTAVGPHSHPRLASSAGLPGAAPESSRSPPFRAAAIPDYAEAQAPRHDQTSMAGPCLRPGAVSPANPTAHRPPAESAEALASGGRLAHPPQAGSPANVESGISESRAALRNPAGPGSGAVSTAARTQHRAHPLPFASLRVPQCSPCLRGERRPETRTPVWCHNTSPRTESRTPKP
jgi:hypothetical protein